MPVKRNRTGGPRESGGHKGAGVRKGRVLLPASVVLLAAAGILQLAARKTAGFGQWYATTVYPRIVGIYGRFCGIFPFSVVEIGLYLSAVWLLLHIASLIFKISRFPSAAVLKKALSDTAVLAVFLTGLLVFLYTACCGINYYRRPFSSYLDLEIRDSSVKELRDLCEFLTVQLNAAAGEDPEGQSPSAAYDPAWNAEGQKAMTGLAEQYPQLAGYYPRPKGLLVSWFLSVQQLSGIYSPFTVEANYNRDMTACNIPHTICHELSHLRGFMREDEANFIGYLACIHSSDRAFRYSGYLTGWIYAGNALAAQDPEAYGQIRSRLNPAVLEDLQKNNAFWNRYEGKVAEASNRMNDTYLKINSQSEGVRSYGRMVDLMLAYYRK